MWQAGRQASKTPQRANLREWGKRHGSGAVRIPGEEEVVAASHSINENPSFAIPQVLQRGPRFTPYPHQKSDCVLTVCIHAASTIIIMRRL